jgi:hypothetical protein
VGRGCSKWPLMLVHGDRGEGRRANAVHTDGVPGAVVLKCGWLRRRAADYGRRARTAIEIERFLEMDRRRFSLARSRECAERVGRFTGMRRRGGEPQE